MFTGSTFLNFDEAVELMQRFKSMEKMEHQILSGQWQQLYLSHGPSTR